MSKFEKEEGGKDDFDYLTSHHRCAWETAGKRCFMPVGFSTGVLGKDKGYCTWHTNYLSETDPTRLKSVDDPDVFDDWILVHRYFYSERHGHDSGCWICKYTKGSLWRSILGDYDDLKLESERVGVPDYFPHEAVKEYKELQKEISNGKHSPESWRVALAALNEKWGVEMSIPPIPTEPAGVGRRVAHRDRSAQEQIEAAKKEGILK